MSAQPVEAVFFWRYSLDSVFRPIYGRFSGSPYTKDFLQASGEQQEVLERVVGFAGDPVPVELRWPGDSRQGNVRRASDGRANLAWITPGGPLPWTLGDPNTEEQITFPGDRTKDTAAGADAELAALRRQGLDPWVVVVKLYGQDRVFHVRAYLGNPPAGQAARSITTLPPMVRAAMQALSHGSAGGVLTFAQLRASKLTCRILEALSRDPNVLLVGPPGTGKTVALEDIRLLFDGRASAASFDPDQWVYAWSEEVRSPGADSKAVSLVFHPSYSYEDFVAGLVPQTDGEGRLRLTARPGPLLSLAHWASDPGRAALLLLDEFNRGPAAAIFGDTLALLDRDKRQAPEQHQEGAVIQRPHPSQSMRVPPHYANGSGRAVLQQVSLPLSLWILAALNSTDRSVAPLDAALRRRFSILYVGPDYSVLANHLGISEPAEETPFAAASVDPATWGEADVKELAIRLLRAMNTRISFVLGQDFLLGHALLWSVNGSDVPALANSLVRSFDERIAATLRLTFVDQDEALAAILNVPIPTPGDGIPRVGRWMEAPPALQTVAPARLELQELAALSWPQAMRALVALLS